MDDALNQRISRELNTFPALSFHPYEDSMFWFFVKQVAEWDNFPFGTDTWMLLSACQVIEGFWLQIIPNQRPGHNYWHLWCGGTMVYVKMSNNVFRQKLLTLRYL
jgi:hypothetical protein